MTRKNFVCNLIQKIENDHKFKINFSFDLPKDFESAFGLFDATKNILYINNSENISYVRFIFTFYHELRHFMQYNQKENFDTSIQNSLNYAIHFDGNCFKLKNNKWLNCKIEDKNLNFIEIYKSSPCELDANNFAYEKSKEVLSASQLQELEKIYNNSLPSRKISNKTIQSVFNRIDELTN